MDIHPSLQQQRNHIGISSLRSIFVKFANAFPFLTYYTWLIFMSHPLSNNIKTISDLLSEFREFNVPGPKLPSGLGNFWSPLSLWWWLRKNSRTERVSHSLCSTFLLSSWRGLMSSKRVWLAWVQMTLKNLSHERNLREKWENWETWEVQWPRKSHRLSSGKPQPSIKFHTTCGGRRCTSLFPQTSILMWLKPSVPPFCCYHRLYPVWHTIHKSQMNLPLPFQQVLFCYQQPS